MEMQEELKTDPVGALHANMVLDNVKETWLNLALLKNTIGILKDSPWLFAFNQTVLTGMHKEVNVHLNMELIGPVSKHAQLVPKEFSM
jgi:hypothetical protein